MNALFLIPLILSNFCFSHSPIPLDDGRKERSHFILSLIKPGAIGAEIGVENGIFSYHVLYPRDPEKLYLIDPWE